MDDEGRLLARLAALEAEVAALRREIGAARGERATMAEDGRCPACGCRRLLHAVEIPDAFGGGQEPLALSRPSAWTTARVGYLQAYVCSRCRLVEWRVDSLDGLDADGSRIRVIDGDDPAAGSPYR
jgi:DNA-directed RNA polymerase subunit RPC12/RpoP